jgi:hypothetical protein
MPEADFVRLAASKTAFKLDLARKFLVGKHGSSPQEIRLALSRRMSEYAAHIRSAEGICKVMDVAAKQLRDIARQTVLASPDDLIAAFENADLLLAQHVYASTMENFRAAGGGSRGSYILPDENGTYEIPGLLKFTPDDGFLSSKIQEVRYSPQGCEFSWEEVRPIPQNDDPFEKVWREYRDDTII